MSGYVDLFWTTDPAEMRDWAYEYLESVVPGWTPHPDSPDTYLLDAVIQMAVPLAYAANQEGEQAAAGFFRDRLGITPGEGSPPQLTIVWEVRDDTGWTIPAGALVSVQNPRTDGVTFHLPSAVVVPPGDTTAPGVVYALEPGSLLNGVEPGSGDVQLVDVSDFIVGVTPTGVISGGVDPESEDDFLDRGSREMRLMARTLVRPEDFAVAAALDQDIARATAIDGFVPPSDTGVPLAVAVAVHGHDGQPAGSLAKNRVKAALEARAIVNMIVSVIDPTYTDMDVTAAAVAHPGWDPAEVKAAAEAAVTEYLSPAGWGIPPDGAAAGGWSNQTVVRYFEVVHVLESVPGLDVLSSLSLNSGAVDVNLSGVAPLPRIDAPGDVVVTVTAP